MNRKEKRAEAKRQHKENINSNINQEESMNEKTQEAITLNTHPNQEDTMEITTTELQTKAEQPGFFTRIKNAFRNGYREGKACIKEQVQEIKETYASVLEERGNTVIKHAKAATKTAFHIIKKTLRSILSLIALPFIKLDSIIDPQQATQS